MNPFTIEHILRSFASVFQVAFHNIEVETRW